MLAISPEIFGVSTVVSEYVSMHANRQTSCVVRGSLSELLATRRTAPEWMMRFWTVGFLSSFQFGLIMIV